MAKTNELKELIRIAKALEPNVDNTSSNTVVASIGFESVSINGTLDGGKAYASFLLISGGATLNGTSMIVGETVAFERIPGKVMPEFVYTVSDTTFTDPQGNAQTDPGLLHISWGE